MSPIFVIVDHDVASHSKPRLPETRLAKLLLAIGVIVTFGQRTMT